MGIRSDTGLSAQRTVGAQTRLKLSHQMRIVPCWMTNINGIGTT